MAIYEIFLAKFGDVASFGGTSKQSEKIFFYFLPISESFFPQKVSRYAVSQFKNASQQTFCERSHVLVAYQLLTNYL